jgi:hypothetical protein
MGMEQQVNTVSMLEQSAPHVAGLAGGGYVVTWRFVQERSSFPGGLPGVFARRYTAAGAAAGPEQVVATSYWVSESAIAALRDGGYYVVAWSVTSKTTVYVYMQRFDATGGKVDDPT